MPRQRAARGVLLCLLALAALPPGAGVAHGGTAPAADPAHSPIGRWRLIDDETHSARGVVEITDAGAGELQGRFVQAYPRPGEDPNALCEKCEGERHNQPMLGMVIMWGLKPDGPGHWSGGHILDPTKGRTYGAKLELLEGGSQLRVRGYFGISLLGRSQTWERMPATAAGR
jgi:hypothetical protein